MAIQFIGSIVFFCSVPLWRSIRDPQILSTLCLETFHIAPRITQQLKHFYDSVSLRTAAVWWNARRLWNHRRTRMKMSVKCDLNIDDKNFCRDLLSFILCKSWLKINSFCVTCWSNVYKSQGQSSLQLTTRQTFEITNQTHVNENRVYVKFDDVKKWFRSRAVS